MFANNLQINFSKQVPMKSTKKNKENQNGK